MIAVKLEIFRETKDGCIIHVLVRPNAKRSEITEMTREALEVSLRSPPMKNKANSELIELLSSVFDVTKSEIQIVSGKQSREKFVSIARQKTYLEMRLTALKK